MSSENQNEIVMELKKDCDSWWEKMDKFEKKRYEEKIKKEDEMRKKRNEERIVTKNDENNAKWKNYIRSELEKNLGCFVEIRIRYADPDDETPEEYTNVAMCHGIKNIQKRELIFILKIVCEEYNFKYFIQPLNYDDYGFSIVLSVIH